MVGFHEDSGKLHLCKLIISTGQAPEYIFKGINMHLNQQEKNTAASLLRQKKWWKGIFVQNSSSS